MEKVEMQPGGSACLLPAWRHSENKTSPACLCGFSCSFKSQTSVVISLGAQTLFPVCTGSRTARSASIPGGAALKEQVQELWRGSAALCCPYPWFTVLLNVFNLGSCGRHNSCLQTVTAQEEIAQGSSQGKTTEREKSPLVLLSGVCFPAFMPGTKMRRDSLKDFFYQLALANRTLNVVSLYDPMSPPEQNLCNFFCAIPGLSACIVSNWYYDGVFPRL